VLHHHSVAETAGAADEVAAAAVADGEQQSGTKTVAFGKRRCTRAATVEPACSISSTDSTGLGRRSDGDLRNEHYRTCIDNRYMMTSLRSVRSPIIETLSITSLTCVMMKTHVKVNR